MAGGVTGVASLESIGCGAGTKIALLLSSALETRKQCDKIPPRSPLRKGGRGRWAHFDSGGAKCLA